MGLIPMGDYEAIASGPLEFVNSSKKGSPGVRVVFRVTSGEHSGTTVPWSPFFGAEGKPGKKSPDERIAEGLTVCGYDGSDPSSVMRSAVKIVVDHDEYEGNVRARVAFVNDPNGPWGGFVQMSPGETQAAKDRLRGLVLAKKSQVTPAMQQSKVKF